MHMYQEFEHDSENILQFFLNQVANLKFFIFIFIFFSVLFWAMHSCFLRGIEFLTLASD